MAEKSIIISAEEEAILLKPIDEYVGKIQGQIDALRVEGSDKVNSLKNQIAIAKENKNLTKEEQNKIIGECKKNQEKAKATEDANKQQIAKLIADAEGFLSKHYNSEYYNIVAKSCEAEKKAENSNFEKLKAKNCGLLKFRLPATHSQSIKSSTIPPLFRIKYFIITTLKIIF